MAATQSAVMIDESGRQRALDGLHVLDSLPEAVYDDIVHLASTLCDTPAALISLIDRDRQWFKAKLGFDDPQTSRDVALCDHAIRTPGKLFEVPNLGDDPRFAANPYINGTVGSARFYAGMPLVTSEGAAIGTVCVVDDIPRQLDPKQRAALQSLARLTMTLLEGRSRERTLEHEAFVTGAAPSPSMATVDEAAMPMPYTLALLELQDHAGTVARLGERGTEKALQALDGALEGTLSAGDAINRSSGNVEYVAVLHGDGAVDAIARIREVLARFRESHALSFLVGIAESDGRESAPAVFMRADTDLLAHKPPPAETTRNAQPA